MTPFGLRLDLDRLAREVIRLAKRGRGRLARVQIRHPPGNVIPTLEAELHERLHAHGIDADLDFIESDDPTVEVDTVEFTK